MTGDGPTRAVAPERARALFTRSDGTFLCARWGRPQAPVVFGVDDATLGVVKGALEAVAQLAGRPLAETDPELGSNLMLFFVRDWAELAQTPGLDRLIPDLGPLLSRLEGAGANQYRVFRFDAAGAICACFAFLRLDRHMAALPAETVALSQAVHAALLWSDEAFLGPGNAMMARNTSGHTVLRPEIAAVIRAAYDPVLPDVSRDPAHALRLAARASAPQ
jgi:hypothetical protein